MLTWWRFSPSVMNILTQGLGQVFKLLMVVVGENILKYFTLLGEHALSKRLDRPPSFTWCNQDSPAVIWQDLVWPEDGEVMRCHFLLWLLLFDCHLRTRLRGCHKQHFLKWPASFIWQWHLTQPARLCVPNCVCLVSTESRPQTFCRIEAKPQSWAGPLYLLAAWFIILKQCTQHLMLVICICRFSSTS